MAEPPDKFLTLRRLQVLHLLRSGLITKEIAGRLRLSPRTVEECLDDLRRHYGARSRAHLAAITTFFGIPPPPPPPGHRTGNRKPDSRRTSTGPVNTSDPPVGGKVLPERCGYYLGHRMADPPYSSRRARARRSATPRTEAHWLR